MKKITLFLTILLSYFALSQNQDLYSLAKGDFLGFNALFDDNDNLYGYVSLYGYGKSGEKTKKFEYVILDKNLNPIANKEFEGDATAGDYFGYIDFRKKVILAPYSYDYSIVKNKDFFSPRSIEIDLATNTPKNKVYYDFNEGTFNEIAQPKNWKTEKIESKSEKKEKGYNYVSDVYEIKEGGFLVTEYRDYGSYTNNNSLMKFDENKNLLWSYKYNQNGDKNNGEYISIIEKDEKHIYTQLMKRVNKKESYYLQVMDINTGKVIFTKPILGALDETIHSLTYVYAHYKSNGKNFDDKIVIVGYNYKSQFNIDGFSQMIIDKKNFNVEIKTIHYIDFKNSIPQINEKGIVENGFNLQKRDFFFLEDGSVGILMEKYKPEGQYNASKTTDMVYAFTDKDFNIKEIKTFEKDKTKWNNDDYLFSQYLNDGKDVVFFYRDLQKDDTTKEKNWKLFINTLIDGQFKQEEVQISEKDKYMTYPYVGKEGYILLREFNEKDKYNKIRLERLNY